MGYPRATTQNYGYNTHGQKIVLHAENLGTGWDLDHSAGAFFNECNGRGKLPGTKCRMNGWNTERVAQDAPKHPAYAYVSREKIQAYWDIAQQYVLSDRTFASNLDGSFVAHQYTIAAYASHAVDYPLTYWGCEGGPTDKVPTLKQDRSLGRRIQPSLRRSVDRKRGRPGRRELALLYGRPERRRWPLELVSGQPQSLRRPRLEHQYRQPAVAVPHRRRQRPARRRHLDHADLGENSDHSGLYAKGGPAWIASLVNAIGESKFWKTTAIFIMWDDWGGRFDPVEPVYEDYDGLGFRVPLIVVSPYAKNGTVTHVQYETASVLRYIEDNFGLPPLAASDGRANDPANDPAVFDYLQHPRPFKKIGGGKPAAYWRHVEREEQARGMPGHIIGDD